VICSLQKPLPDDTRQSQETDIHPSLRDSNLQLLHECGRPTVKTARPLDSASCGDGGGRNSVVTALISRCYGNLNAQGLRNRKWNKSVCLFYFSAASLDALFFISLPQVFRGIPNWSSSSYVSMCLNDSHVDKSQLPIKLKWLYYVLRVICYKKKFACFYSQLLRRGITVFAKTGNSIIFLVILSYVHFSARLLLSAIGPRHLRRHE